MPTTEATTEQDHHQTARPTTQRADLHSSRSHGWLLRLYVGDRSRMALVRELMIDGASDHVTGGDGMSGQWRRLLPGHATSPAVGYDLVRRRVWAPRSWAFWVALSASS